MIWVEKVNYEHFKQYLNKGSTAISRPQVQFTSFLKVFKMIENLSLIWLTLLVHLVTDVILLLMSVMQLCTNNQMNQQNVFEKSCLKTCEWYRMLKYSTVENLRRSETPCSMLSIFHTGASKMQKSVLLVNWHIWQFNCLSECQRVPWSWAFQEILIHDVKNVFICYIYTLKLPWNSDNSSIQNICEQNYIDSAMLSYSYPFEYQFFHFSSLK